MATAVLEQPKVNATEQPVEKMDEFGRTEAERTVVLSSRDAERINNEVTDGKHDTYDEALAYVIERGFKEIERQRLSAIKQEGQRLVAKAMEKFNKILATTPTLVSNRIALIAAVKATLTRDEFTAIEQSLKLLFPEPTPATK